MNQRDRWMVETRWIVFSAGMLLTFTPFFPIGYALIIFVGLHAIYMLLCRAIKGEWK